MSEKEFIQIKALSKNFDDVVAVDNVDINVAKGEFFSLLGPSGCGKTTLLRILAGFEYPSKGSVSIDNVDVTDMPANLRPTNMVFQNYAIFPHINVKRNIEFGLKSPLLPDAVQAFRNLFEEMNFLILINYFLRCNPIS